VPIRINPRALEAACKAALEGGRLGRRWDELSDDERRGVLAQGAALLRAYDEAKVADLGARRAHDVQSLRRAGKSAAVGVLFGVAP
jgi:hypothetical protein